MSVVYAFTLVDMPVRAFRIGSESGQLGIYRDSGLVVSYS